MPTDNGATDLQGAAKLLTERMTKEREAPTDGEGSETEEKPTQTEATPANAAADTEQEEQEKYTVKVDGEEFEVTLEELKSGFMMEKNYRNKTTALNKEREALNERAATIDSQLEDAKLIIEADLAELQTPEMQALKEDDPREYLDKENKIRAKIERFEKLKAKRENELSEKQAKLLAKEQAALAEMFPAWANDKDAHTKDVLELIDVIKSFGYNDSEINSISDHRIFLLADKARRFEAMEKKLAKATEQLQSKAVETRPKNVKPGVSSSTESLQSDAYKQARAKFKKTGSIKDAMAAMKLNQ